jgi:excisionase family DNA binding protein
MTATLDGAHRPPLDVKQTAEYLGVTERFVRELRAKRKVPCIKMGRLVKFDPDDLDRYLDDCRELPPTPYGGGHSGRA